MSQRIGGTNPGTYLGVNALTPPNFRQVNRAPTTNDTKTFRLGDIWQQTNTENFWILAKLSATMASPNVQVADWVKIANGSLAVYTLTGDDNVAVAPIANNINVVAQRGVGSTAGSTVNFIAVLPGNLSLQVSDDSLLNTIIGLTAGNNTITGNNNTILGTDAFTDATSATSNVGMGYLSLSHATTGSFNTALGTRSLEVGTTASNNVAVGYNAASSLTNGTQNVFVGMGSGADATTADNNVAVGWAALDDLVTGSNNIAVGLLAGTSYTTAESSNIVIGNSGVISENNTIRIGTQGGGAGQQNAAYMAGVYQAAVGGTNEIVIVDSNGKLGSTNATVTGNPIAFTGLINAENNISGDGTVAMLGAVTAMTTLANIGAAFFPGDGAGTEASFTAPVTGTYALTFTLATSIPAGGGLVQGWSMYLNGVGFNAVSQLPTSNQVPGFQGTNGYIDASGAIITPLTAGDIITWTFTATGGARTSSTVVGYVGGALLGTLNNGGGANSFIEDSGSAAPLAGVLNVLGDGGGLITTSGAGNTVTVNAAYQHGTWTPTITFGGGSTGITYASNVADYIKIGQLIFANYHIVMTSKGSDTGTALLNGLPFTNTGAIVHNHCYSGGLFLTFDAGYTYMGIALSGTTAAFEEYGSGQNVGQMTDTNFANNTTVFGTFCYSTGVL